MGVVYKNLINIVPEDIVYSVLPLYHISGLCVGTGQMVINGTTMVLRKKFSASNFSSDCFKYKCTVSNSYGSLRTMCVV